MATAVISPRNSLNAVIDGRDSLSVGMAGRERLNAVIARGTSSQTFMTTVSIPASAWTFSAENVYSQVVTINGATSNSSIDLKPDVRQSEWLFDHHVAMSIVNDSGTFTAYAVGGRPSIDFTIQATVAEVSQV